MNGMAGMLAAGGPWVLGAAGPGSGAVLAWWRVPELWWVAAGTLLLVWDAFRGKKSGWRVPWISLVGFGLALVWSVLWENRPDAAAFGGPYVWDGMAVFFKRLFLLAGLVSAWMTARGQGEREHGPGSPSAGGPEAAILPWFAVAGMGLMVSASDFVTAFVAVELLTVSFYVLVAARRDDAGSLEAGVKYLILGALSSAVLVYGIAWIYGSTGSLAYAEVAAKAGDAGGKEGFRFGMVLVLAGVAFKLAAFPFHWWAPDVYQGAPMPVTALLATGSKAAGFGLLLRLVDGPFAGEAAFLRPLLALVAAGSILFGNLGALAQRDLKRLMGYSSISHAGFLLMGVAAGSQAGVEGACFYLMVYVFATALIFGVAGELASHLGGSELRRFAGMARRDPGLALMLLIGMVSLAGLPPLAGFFGKWFLFAAAWEAGLAWLVGVGIVGAAASLYFYLAIGCQMFFEAPEGDAKAPQFGLAFRASLSLLLLGVLVAGMVPAPFWRLVRGL